jgi:hypothetical protein
MLDQNTGGDGCANIADSDDESSSSGGAREFGLDLSLGLPTASIRICGSDTDSNSDVDCVYIDREIVVRENKGEGDSDSPFEDSQCDPRFSSCDTDSEGSSDSHTSSEDDTAVVGPGDNNNDGSECDRSDLNKAQQLACKFGISLPSESSESSSSSSSSSGSSSGSSSDSDASSDKSKKHKKHGYGYGHHSKSGSGSSSGSGSDSDSRSRKSHSTDTESGITSFSEDSCDTSDNDTFCRIRRSSSSGSANVSGGNGGDGSGSGDDNGDDNGDGDSDVVSKSSGLPNTGTSDSSNSDSLSDSLNDSSSGISSSDSDGEEDDNIPSEDECYHVDFNPKYDFDTHGWLEIKHLGETAGNKAGYTRMFGNLREASIEGEDEGSELYLYIETAA